MKNMRERAKNALQALHLFQFASRLRQLASRLHQFASAAKFQYAYGGTRNLLRYVGARITKWWAGVLPYSGRNDRWCPCCGWRGPYFLPYIDVGYVTFGAECPNCGSHARHRGQRLFYERRLNSPRGELLYFTTEKNIDYFRNMPALNVRTSEYSKTDQADFHFDLLNIESPSSRWDYVVCHRVIEHLPDDVRGMEELLRILKPGGTLVMSVPIDRHLEKTIEYGKPNQFESDHYYAYGKDFPSRIPAEFKVHSYDFREEFSESDFRSLGLVDDCVFLCVK